MEEKVQLKINSAPGALVKSRLAAGLDPGIASAHHLAQLHGALEEVVHAQAGVSRLRAERLEVAKLVHALTGGGARAWVGDFHLQLSRVEAPALSSLLAADTLPQEARRGVGHPVCATHQPPCLLSCRAGARCGRGGEEQGVEAVLLSASPQRHRLRLARGAPASTILVAAEEAV